MASKNPDRPNIVLVHCHDLGRHLGCYGVPSVPSPNIDQLAAHGNRYSNAFCTAPLCSPARASISTGRYPHSVEMNGLAHRGFSYSADALRLPAMLEPAGYRTALFGVQHESTDATTLDYQQVHAQIDRHAPAVAASACGWLEEAARGDGRPFYANIGFVEVHRPYGPQHYPPDDPRSVSVPAWLPDNDWTRDDLASFQGAIRVADEAAGQIFATLTRTGLAENTWLIFTTDHGAGFPGGKSTLYDPGIGVALIQQFPLAWGLRSGVTVDALWSHVDLVPTILSRLGVPVPNAVEGVDQNSSLHDPEHGGIRDRIYAEKSYHNHYDPMRCVRTSTHKLIVNYEERPRLVLPPGIERCATRFGMGDDHLRHRDRVELYDLRNDPEERDNVAESVEQVRMRQELSDDLLGWQRSTSDPVLQGQVPPAPWPRLAKFGALTPPNADVSG